MQNNKTRVPYTDRGEVKAFIELQHAKHGRNHTPLWDMGCDLPSVNAAYLYEMLTIFPDAAIYANVDSPYSPLYFVSTMGDGILLPVRTPIRRREPTAAQIISAAIEKNPACPEISLDQLAVIAKEYGAA